jgi:molybdenum cofactor biosynthesis protein B
LSKVAEHHKAIAPKSLGLFIVTCSTSRFKQVQADKSPEDTSGDIIERLAIAAGHYVVGRKLVSDSKTVIQRTAKQALASRNANALILTGGTGLSLRDVTIESITPLITKQIPGFGELFRKLSFDKIGAAAMMSRAFAGLAKDKAVFCLPGSPDAVRTAMEELILPELSHIIGVAREDLRLS